MRELTRVATKALESPSTYFEQNDGKGHFWLEPEESAYCFKMDLTEPKQQFKCPRKNNPLQCKKSLQRYFSLNEARIQKTYSKDADFNEIADMFFSHATEICNYSINLEVIEHPKELDFGISITLAPNYHFTYKIRMHIVQDSRFCQRKRPCSTSTNPQRLTSWKVETSSVVIASKNYERCNKVEN